MGYQQTWHSFTSSSAYQQRPPHQYKQPLLPPTIRSSITISLLPSTIHKDNVNPRTLQKRDEHAPPHSRINRRKVRQRRHLAHTMSKRRRRPNHGRRRTCKVIQRTTKLVCLQSLRERFHVAVLHISRHVRAIIHYDISLEPTSRRHSRCPEQRHNFVVSRTSPRTTGQKPWNMEMEIELRGMLLHAVGQSADRKSGPRRRALGISSSVDSDLI